MAVQILHLNWSTHWSTFLLIQLPPCSSKKLPENLGLLKIRQPGTRNPPSPQHQLPAPGSMPAVLQDSFWQLFWCKYLEKSFPLEMKQSVSKCSQMIDLINVCNNKPYAIWCPDPIWDTRDNDEGGKKKIKTRVRLNSMEPKLQNIILSYHQRDEMF